MIRSEWALPLVVVAGLLALPFYRAELLRERFIGDHLIPDSALTGVVLLGLAVALLSLLRRDFIRAHPAALTWNGPREVDMRRAWAVRFGAVGYLFAAAGSLLGWPGAPQLALVFAAAATFGYVAARRARKAWLECAVVFGLASAGAFFAGPGWLWVVAGGLVVATGLASGPPHRAGRAELVRGYRAHVLRSVAASFGDVLAVLPSPRPTRMRLGTTLRFVVAGVAARRGMLAAAVLLALAAPVLHAVFPVVAPVWWAGIGAYAATLPFAGGLGDATRVAGLRRWLPQTDVELWATAVVVLMVVAGLWLALATLAGLPAVPQAIPLAAAAVARTVSRPDLDYSPSPALDVGGLYLPVNLVRQLVRGPLLLLVGLAALG